MENQILQTSKCRKRNAVVVDPTKLKQLMQAVKDADKENANEDENAEKDEDEK